MAPTSRRHRLATGTTVTKAATGTTATTRATVSTVIVLALLLSGCTLASPAASEPTSTRMSPPASAPTQTPITTPTLEIGTIVATGRLIGDDLIAGDVDVRVTGKGIFELRLLNFRSERNGDVELRVVPIVVEPGAGCTGSPMQFSYGNLPPGAHHVFPLMGDFLHDDPSFLDSVIISTQNPVAAPDGCHLNVLASAILDWTLPDMRPGLTVSDAGRTGGAAGIVTIVDGEPRSYTVAPDDLSVEVAARLGITEDDLFYLNPNRTAMVRHPLLQAGEVLNLSKTHR